MIKRYNLYPDIHNGWPIVHVLESGFGCVVKYEDHEREVKELERRVRWLEQGLMLAFVKHEREEKSALESIEAMLVFKSHGTQDMSVRPRIVVSVKPTPEDFE